MNVAAASVNGSKFESRTKNGGESTKMGESGGASGMLKDSPRSLNDYKFTVSPRGQDTDNEILDLDVYDLTDDDESWLYSSPSGKMTYTDISEWLRKDVDNSDPITRRALVVKLETYLRRKGSAGSIGGNDSSDGEKRFSALKNTSVSSTVQSKSSTGNGVKKQEPVLYNKTTISPSKTFVHSDNRAFFNQGSSANTDKNEHPPLTSKNSDLNPDIKDIHLLASMQEQDLRNCLQQMNLTRRRMTPENQDRMGTSPKTYAAQLLANGNNSPLSSFSAGNSPKFPTDLSATYVKPTDAKLALSRKVSNPVDAKKLSKGASLSVEPQYTGLRKSLPNLAASRSGEFSLPINDSNSEKGSCGDVSGGMSPSCSTHGVVNGRRSTPSRIPTFRNSSSRSGIPVPRSRAKSPAPKMTLQTRFVDHRWNDGCI